MIRGTTTLIAHVGDPITPVKSPMIYNPFFERRGIDAVVVPMGVTATDYAGVFASLFRIQNMRGALVTMPHKVSTVPLVDGCSDAVRLAGSCNAVRRDGSTLYGDLFDGEGFVRGVARKGFRIDGARCLVVGIGGVGSAIAAALAAAGASMLMLFDQNADNARRLQQRLREHYPTLDARSGSRDPAGFDLVVNATPLGMNADDPLPIDVDRLSARTFVGEVVMKQEITPLLAAAQQRGCPIQIGTDMLFEQIPAYLEFFGLPTTTAEDLRAVARLG